VPCAPARGRGVSRACLTHAVRLRGRAQIETLAGQVLAAEVDSSASLAAMRAGIQRETGVLAEQQRFIILGAPLMRAELAGAGGVCWHTVGSRSHIQLQETCAQALEACRVATWQARGH